MNNETQQTAVDLMFQRAMFLLPMGSIDARQSLKETYQQAKEMEKEQIAKAYDDAIMKGRQEDGEQYYEQTYGGNK
jgi:hypothetical protein